jgi:hypothetical protein
LLDLHIRRVYLSVSFVPLDTQPFPFPLVSLFIVPPSSFFSCTPVAAWRASYYLILLHVYLHLLDDRPGLFEFYRPIRMMDFESGSSFLSSPSRGRWTGSIGPRARTGEETRSVGWERSFPLIPLSVVSLSLFFLLLVSVVPKPISEPVPVSGSIAWPGCHSHPRNKWYESVKGKERSECPYGDWGWHERVRVHSMMMMMVRS